MLSPKSDLVRHFGAAFGGTQPLVFVGIILHTAVLFDFVHGRFGGMMGMVPVLDRDRRNDIHCIDTT